MEMTKSYQLICGSSTNVAEFEEKISTALEQGYELVDDLRTQATTKADGQAEVLFFQAMIFDQSEDDDFDDDEFDMEDALEEESEEEYITS